MTKADFHWHAFLAFLQHNDTRLARFHLQEMTKAARR